jgi:hypothetical protein
LRTRCHPVIQRPDARIRSNAADSLIISRSRFLTSAFRNRQVCESSIHSRICCPSGGRKYAFYILVLFAALPDHGRQLRIVFIRQACRLVPPTPECTVMTFTATASYIVSLSVSCTFFGISCTTFILCIRSLCDVPFRTFTRVRWMLFAVCCGMLVISGVSIGQQMRHNLNAFVYYEGGGHAAEELNNPRDPTNYIHVRITNLTGHCAEADLS